MSEPVTTIFVAGAVRDAAPSEAVNLRPGAVAVREGHIIEVGEPDAVMRETKQWGPVQRIDLPDRLILPAMVNAHAHLDLTDIGPVPYDPAGGFVGWVEMVLRKRPQREEAITRAVRNGLQMSKAAGVGLIGDIAGSDAAMAARLNVGHDEWLPGCSYFECFGRTPEAVAFAADRWNHWSELYRKDPRSTLLRAELQPHAPYSAGRHLYEVAHDYFGGLPCTHLAETLEEDQFVRDASGPLADLVRRLGKWSDSIVPHGVSPIEYLSLELQCGVWIVVHCNYVSDADLAILQKATASVAYCPIASDYFGHRNHRYREMLEAGINVCLGTDSVLCQHPFESQPLGILPQMRHLYRRDKTGPETLLEMATLRGASALAMDPNGVSLHCTKPQSRKFLRFLPAPDHLKLGVGRQLIAIRFDPSDPTDPLTQILLNDYPVEPLAG